MTEDDKELYVPRRKGKVAGLATPFAKAYVERERRKREEVAHSPLLSRSAISGRGCLHLREEENGTGTLLVNGSIVVHVNVTALLYLKLLFSNEVDERILRRITSKFKVSSTIARQDLARLRSDLERLEHGEPPARGTRVEPLSGMHVAPMRADLALTYRTKDTEGKSPPSGAPKDLLVEEWLKALDNLWTFGVPHVCITGGEPTLREDLVEIVEHASSLGMMVGLLTDGERLGSHAFLGRLLDAGLAYVQISIASHDETIHAKVTSSPEHRKTVNAIRHCIKEGLPVLVNVPITKESEYDVEETVNFLVKLGVKDITVSSLGTGEKAVPDWMVSKSLERARKAARGHARIFYFGPLAGKAPPQIAPGDTAPVGDLAIGDLEWGAGLVSIHVHPDGSVTGGRGHTSVLGNVLTHSWNMIWYHSLLKDIRAKQLEGRRWRALQELGFNGYPLFPGLKVQSEPDESKENI